MPGDLYTGYVSLGAGGDLRNSCFLKLCSYC